MTTGKTNSRRRFLAGALTGAATIATATGAAGARAEQVGDDVKVRFDELLPHEFRARLAERPIAYLPLGTIEWHGEHLALGSDAIQAEGLMVACARRFGGIVMPPIHLGPDRMKESGDGETLIGMDYAASTTPPRQLDGSCYWVSDELHVQLVDAILAQLKRAGFTAVFGDGHGPSRWSWKQHLEERERQFGLKLFGAAPGGDNQWRSQVDHAGQNETSLMMHIRPELVDLSQLPNDRAIQPQGVGGVDPRDASPEFGKECFEESAAAVRQQFLDAGLL